MYYHSASLLRIFCVFTILWCGYTNQSGGDTVWTGDNAYHGTGQNNGTNTGNGRTGGEDPGNIDVLKPAKIIYNTICPSGQYVAKCGKYSVGFNWLSGMPQNASSASECENLSGKWDSQNSTCYTKDYYYTNDVSELLEQMRVFFKADANQSIYYCKKRDSTTNSCTETKSYTEYKQDRDTILSNVCDPFDLTATITCARCPNGASVPKSSVTLDLSEKTAVGWVFYTIADCYVAKFTDVTGDYEYITEQNNGTDKKQYCYYNPLNATESLYGDSIADFVYDTDEEENTTE